MDQGAVNTPFAEVNSYKAAGGSNASLLSHKLTIAADNIVKGKTYTFKFRAVNAVGKSAFSEVIRVGLGIQVLPPSTLSADLDKAGPTFLKLVWAKVVDADIPTLGYTLE
jgi:hypothetical protein